MSDLRKKLIDITNEKEVQAVINSIGQTIPHIDLLINNAGVASMNAFLLTPAKTADARLKLNVSRAFYILQAIGKMMVRQRKGLIINITTVAVPLELEGEAAYVASKAALDGLTRVVAKELKSQGVMLIGLVFWADGH
jgi:3-oxoacyl-[acyl-carrier protein] reductase